MNILIFLYALIIAPLRGAMEFVLHLAYGLTGSWGASIILLSLAVNIALIPVYHLAESWQEDERGLQKRMAAKLAEVKAVYHGRERYMFVRAIYRIFGYHPLMALRTSLGLLIQIPFFFAAYNLLHNNPALEGVGFYFIGNLGQPDALFSLGGFAINLLPFIMTGVNLASAALYSARLNRRDKVQLYVLAALFLLLLYNAAAGLLLYWTCNNIFSFFKNIVYRLYIYEDSKRALPQAILLIKERLGMLGRALQSLGQVLGRWTGPLLFMGGLALYAGTESIWKKQYLLPAVAACLLLLLCALLAQRARGAALGQNDKTLAGQNFLGWLFVTILGLLLFVIYSEGKFRTPERSLYTCLHIAATMLLVLWVLRSGPISTLFYRAGCAAAKRIDALGARRLFMASLLTSGALIFIYQPFALFSSDPEFFTLPLPKICGTLVFYFLLFIGISLYIFSKSAAMRPLFSLIAAWLAISALLYNFVAVFDYGVMNGPFLGDPGALSGPLPILADALVLLGAAGILWLITSRNRLAALSGALQALCIMVLAAGILRLALAQKQDPEQTRQRAHGLPEYSERLFSFSAKGRNILIITLDAFTADHLDIMMQEEPELFEHYTGFTWYRDNMSPGSQTLLSIAAISGGERYTPVSINKRRERPLREMYQEAYSVLPNLLLPQGYDVALVDLERFYPDGMEKFCPRLPEVLITRQAKRDFVDYWLQSRGYPMVERKSPANFMSVFGFFHSSPSFLRRHIYRGGSWLRSFALQDGNSTGGKALIDTMVEFASLSDVPGTLKNIHSNATHAICDLGENCEPLSEELALAKRVSLPDGRNLSHYWAERCMLRSIAQLLDWFKDKGIYDNTQVFIVSDHTSGDITRFGKSTTKLGSIMPGANALLLVKNFGDKQPFAISDAPTYVSDILAFICRAGNFCGNLDLYDPLAEQKTARRRTFSKGHSNLKAHNKDNFITEDWEVIGPAWDENNWRSLKK